MGINAVNPLDGGPVVVNDQNAFTDDHVQLIDLGKYFTGGNPAAGLTYMMSPMPLPPALTAAVGATIEDNMLKVTPDATAAPTASGTYTNVFARVRATDADGRIADNFIAIRRNQAPTGLGSITAIRIGTQPDAIMAADQDGLFGTLTNWMCSSFDTCTLDLFPTNINDNVPPDVLKYTATPDDSENFSVAPAEMGITITGMMATDAAVEVTTNATDSGMLEVAETSRGSFDVIVDAQPEKVGDIADIVLERYAEGGLQYKALAATAGLPAFFKDPEDATLTFSFSYDDDTVVLARIEQFDHDGDTTTATVPVIELRSLNVGTAEVTVRATEPAGGTAGIGQYVEGSFTVTVNP